MRHPWSVSLLLALAAVAGYAAGIRPVQAQVEAFPFQVGETVTLGFQDKGTRPCWIREIKGMFARCGSTAERDGRLYSPMARGMGEHRGGRVGREGEGGEVGSASVPPAPWWRRRPPGSTCHSASLVCLLRTCGSRLANVGTKMHR